VAAACVPRARDRVRGILLETIVTDFDAWFADLDRFIDVPFMEEGRNQPPLPDAQDPFE
jgi:antitoxin VapB